jgi:hypothetical protein
VADLLARLEETHKAATPGPWIADSHEIYQALPYATDLSGDWIGETCRIDGDPLGPGDADAAAIVAAHNHQPALIAAVRAVLALADELEPLPRIITGSYAADRLRSAVAAALGAEVTA